MTALSPPLRDAVASRANHRCEYCQLLAQLRVGSFEVDHILPRSRGGLTDMANLAFACPHGQNSNFYGIREIVPRVDDGLEVIRKV
jgi:5-methylcytosine-specific restriction endonuclease McrA